MNTINVENIKRSVMLISDTHVWSDYALVSREPVYNATGRHLNPPEVMNEGQKIIQSYWYDEFIPTCDRFNVDTIIHFSDAVQGVNPKERESVQSVLTLTIKKRILSTS